MSQRLAKINRLLRMTLGEFLPTLVHDPRVHAADLVVVQDVQTSPDLSHAKVYVSIESQSERVRQEALDGLQQARGFLRREIGQRVRLRRMPELRFMRDQSGQSVTRVAEILHEIEVEQASPKQVELEEVARLIGPSHRILLTTHPDPDGDAIGSTLALLLALKAMGKDAVAFNPDPVPDRFRFLRGAELFVHTLPETGFELTLVLDCSDARMFQNKLPPREWLGHVVAIDHHKTVGEIANAIYRDPEAASAGVLIFRLLQLLDVSMDLSMAEALYCSILSDTGSFRYGNTNPECMRVSAVLLEQGLDAWHVASNLYESQPPKQLELLAIVLRTLKVSPDGRAAALLVSEQMLNDTGCTSDMVDGFINYARALRGVEVGILMRVQSTGFRVSLRSRGKVDVSEIATGFGGGGHHNAAGFTVEREAIDTPDALLPLLFEEVARRWTNQSRP